MLIFFLVFLGKAQSVDSVVFAFYNVENLFDTIKHPINDDGEFLPHGMKGWNTERYKRKLLNLSRVINAMNAWQGPDVIGLCEVENRLVLNDLINTKGLQDKGYRIIHRESPDNRGIDVCALYKPRFFELIDYDYISVVFSDSDRPTREILYIRGKIIEADTVHLFYNHWPSRFGGEAVSEPRRVFVAQLLHSKLDSILKVNEKAKIYVSGDFNDTPSNKSIEVLTADSVVFAATLKNTYPGTHKFQAEWNTFDQVFVSKALFFASYKAEVFTPDWLTMIDDKFTGTKPFRTFSGPNYLGGFSDHFGVVFKLKTQKE